MSRKVKVVEWSGPVEARLAWIGESPGKDEVREGKPFVGASGKIVRAALERGGMNPAEVRFGNVVDVMWYPFPAGKKGWELVYGWWDKLHARLGEMEGLKVVVACGLWAARALTGWDEQMASFQGGWYYLESREDVVVVVVPHPSAIALRDPYRTFLPVFRRWVYRAVEAAREGRGEKVFIPTPRVKDWQECGFEQDEWVVDFEYDPATYTPNLLGFAPAGVTGVVYQAWGKDIERVVEQLRGKKIIAHNIAADGRCFKKVGGWFPERFEDTMLAHAVQEPDLPHDLSFVARYYLAGVRDWKWMRDAWEDVHVLQEYNALDVDMTNRAWGEIGKALTPHRWREAYERVLKVVPRQVCMEDTGIRIDTETQAELRAEYEARIVEAEQQVMRLVGPAVERRVKVLEGELRKVEEQVELVMEDARRKAEGAKRCGCKRKFTTAPKKCDECKKVYEKFILPAKEQVKVLRNKRTKIRNQLKSIEEAGGFRLGNDNDTRWYIEEMVGERGVGRRARTASGLLKVDLESLRQYADDPVIKAIWEAKHAQKMISTFVDLPVDNGVVHPPIRLLGTASGRPASGRDKVEDTATNDRVFNAFNLPKEVRKMFVPDEEGHVFVQADWKDLEGRLTALVSGDRKLCEMYAKGVDVHSWTAGLLFDIPLEEARDKVVRIGGEEKTARFWAKRLGHGMRYGMGARKLAKTFNIPVGDAKKLYARYMNIFTGIARWQKALGREVFGSAESRGTRYVVTAFEAVRYFPGVPEVAMKRVLAQHGQSDGAYMWYTVVDRLCAEGTCWLREVEGARMVLGTYDSVLVSTPRDKVKETICAVTGAMERSFPELSGLPGARVMGTSFPVEVDVTDTY